MKILIYLMMNNVYSKLDRWKYNEIYQHVKDYSLFEISTKKKFKKNVN